MPAQSSSQQAVINPLQLLPVQQLGSIFSWKPVAGFKGAIDSSATALAASAAGTKPSCKPYSAIRRAPLLASISLNQTSTSPSTSTSTKHVHKSSSIPNVSGTWVKDRNLSDGMRAALDLMALGGVVRTAVKLMKGIQIEQTDTHWSMAVYSVISWFKVTEKYALDGSSSVCKRRDLRKGKHVGHLEPSKRGPHGGLLLSLTWDEPHGGTGTDEFVLVPTGTAAAQAKAAAAAAAATAGVSKQAAQAAEDLGELHVYSNLYAKGQHASYRTVYHRK